VLFDRIAELRPLFIPPDPPPPARGAAQHALVHEVPKLVAATVHVSPRDSTGHDHHAELAHHPTALESGAITR
jgi:hypothetical protein